MRLLTLVFVAVLPACALAQSRDSSLVDAAYRGALTRSPIPRTLARDQAEYARERAATTDRAFRQVLDEARTERLIHTAEVDLMGQTAATTLEALPTECLDLGGVEGCGVVQGGWISGPDDARLFWQIQGGATGMDGLTAGVLFLQDKGGRLDPVSWAFQASAYEAPVAFESEGRWYVAVPGRTFGAGRGDGDLIFRWTPGSDRPLSQIDSWSWRDDLTTRLPGLSAHGRVRIDYQEMVALTEMFRANDAGCCGTGGHALIRFEIQGERLAVSDARLRD